MPRLPLRMYGIRAGFQTHGYLITAASSIFQGILQGTNFNQEAGVQGFQRHDADLWLP